MVVYKGKTKDNKQTKIFVREQSEFYYKFTKYNVFLTFNFFLMNNTKDWRTTIPALIGAFVIMVGLLMPNVVTSEDVTAIQAYAAEIVIGIGGLITTLTGIFSRGGTDPAR